MILTHALGLNKRYVISRPLHHRSTSLWGRGMCPYEGSRETMRRCNVSSQGSLLSGGNVLMCRRNASSQGNVSSVSNVSSDNVSS